MEGPRAVGGSGTRRLGRRERYRRNGFRAHFGTDGGGGREENPRQRGEPTGLRRRRGRYPAGRKASITPLGECSDDGGRRPWASQRFSPRSGRCTASRFRGVLVQGEVRPGAVVVGKVCVQRRQTCSAGGSPTGARARRPVAWMAGRRETKALKPIDEAIRRMGASHRAVTGVNAEVASKHGARRPSAYRAREGSRGRRSLADAAGPLRRGGSDGTVTRARRATGEALLVPPRNRRSRVGPITGAPGKWADGERVAEGPAVATRRGNARGAKGPCCSAMPPATWKAGAS